MSLRSGSCRNLNSGLTGRTVDKKPEPSTAEMVRFIRAFIMRVLAADAIALRPKRPRVRKPITALAEKTLRVLTFHFENVTTALCFPSIATIAKTGGCSKSAVKQHLKALRKAGYVSWKPGGRKRVKTRVGWRVVRDSNRYDLLCPHRHLDALRRGLIRFTGGRMDRAVHALLVRYTPKTREAETASEIIRNTAHDLRPNLSWAAPTAKPEPRPRAPPSTEGASEVGRVRVEDPKLASVLSTLWTALEKRGE